MEKIQLIKLAIRVILKSKIDIGCLVVVFLGLCSCKKDFDIERQYYENGQKKYEVPLKENKRNGRLIEYSVNGEITSYSNWINGVLEGESVVYYEDGKVNQENFFHNGLRSGMSRFFSKNGDLIEVQYFDEKGHVVDYKKFMKDGSQNLDPETRLPIIVGVNDTVNFGEYFSAKIRLGNRRFNNIEVVLGSTSYDPIINNPRLPKVDSVTALIKVKGERAGQNLVQGVILEINKNHHDSILVIPFRHFFYVKKLHIKSI